ncbi:hypothetical protein HFN86_35745 [Rhizobium laguerreae]|uniref:hypothetical protein n=1 Tax=Rhizobium laguerreae TaxID=1076926 RepID=UPI001C8FC1E1|nr:hypothetical protein [Rhizobium laguerreae]MBY3425467.1 hypothetical protein [Rhizobium laguerreae]
MADTLSNERVGDFLDSYKSSINVLTPAADLSSSLGRMKIFSHPFVYGVIDDFLPTALFESVTQNWPSPADFGDVTLPGAEYLGSRKSILLDGPGQKASGEVWAAVSNSLKAPETAMSIFNTFRDTIETNLASLRDFDRSSPGFRLYACRDAGSKEALGAHVDAMRKVLTIVVYVGLVGPVRDGHDRLWGTSLYDVRENSVEPLRFEENAKYEPAEFVGFRPNRAFIMPNDKRALHGVIGGESDIERRSLMCGYWLFSDQSRR